MKIKILTSILLFCLINMQVFSENSVGTPQTFIDVNNSGAATFNLPIEIPDGGGFHPQISIAYNSQAMAYGNVGYGFNITGISVITCAGKNIFYDNEVKGLDFSSNSSFYLDGKRLYLESGVNGSDGAVYSIEGDPCSTVVFHGSMTASSANCWFEIDVPKAGVTYIFGNSDDSRLSFFKGGNERCVAWYIKNALDKYSNEINYSYTKNNLCVLPSSISYGINRTHPRNITCTIDFQYSDIAADNTTDFYIGGIKGTVSRKLSSITTSINSQIYRSYSMVYDESEDETPKCYTRLSTITESNGDGDSYPAIRIDWETLHNNYVQTYDKNLFIDYSNSFQTESGRSFFAVDINGDGISDIIKQSHMSSIWGDLSGYNLYAYLSHIDRNGNVSFTSSVAANYYLGQRIPVGCYSIKDNGMFSIDIDGDGYNDIVSQYYDNMGDESYCVNYQVAFGANNTTGEISTINCPLYNVLSDSPLTTILDVDGDGKDEILYIENKTWDNQYYGNIISITSNRQLRSQRIALSIAMEPKKIFSGDYNNDGLVDILFLSDHGYKIYFNNGYSNSYATVFTNENTASYEYANLENSFIVKQGDFNGDGLLDFVCSKSNDGHLYLELNNGNGTFTERVTTDFGIYDHGDSTKDDEDFTLNVFDFNHDGLCDVMMAKSMFAFHSGGIFSHSYYRYENGEGTTFIKWLESTGENFVLRESYSKKNRERDASPMNIIYGDFDGDGAIEIANYGALLNSNSESFTDDVFHFYKCGSNIPSLNRVSSITNGTGITTSITYSSAINPNVYTKGTGSYPTRSYAIPLNVVSHIKEEGAGISTNETSFSYSGLRIQPTGRGIIGFDSYSRNSHTSGTIESYYVQEWDTVHFIPSKVLQTTSIGEITSSKEINYGINDRYTTRKHRNNYFSYNHSEYAYDFDGHLTETVNWYNADYEAIGSSFVRYDGRQDIFKQTEYYYDEKHGGVYLPDSVYVIQMHPDDDDCMEKSIIYNYDSLGNLLSTIDNSESELRLTKRYTYDCYGNKTSESEEGKDVKTVTSFYEYDSSGRYVSSTSTYPASDSISYRYSIFGDLLEESDNTITDNILVTSHSYNGWGDKTSTTFPDGNYVEWSKDWDNTHVDGCYSITKTPNNGPWEKTIFDAQGREVKYSSVGLKGIGISKETTYTDKGQVAQVVNRNGNLTTTETYTYDNRGRKISETSSTGSSTTYQYNDRDVTTTSAGRTVITTYDALGKVKQIVDPVSTISYTYKSNGKPATIETDGSLVVLEYDENGNRIRMTDPDAGTTTYSYAADGTLLSQTDARGVSTTYTYDNLGRVVQKTYSDPSGNSTCQNNVYGTSGYGKNRIVEQSCGRYTRQFEYDRYGRIISESRDMHHYLTGNQTYTKRFTYNSLNQRVKTSYPLFTTPAAPLEVNYLYDVNGYLNEMKIGFQSIYRVDSYDGLTLEATTSGGVLRKTIDADGYPSVYQFKIGNTVKDIQNFTYNKQNGNLASRSWRHGNSTMLDESFAYDALDRLTEVRNNGSSIMEMTYADNGNITSKTGVGSYSYALANKPHAVTNVSNEGGVINSSTISTDFGHNGKISVISGPNSSFRSYDYGPDDERWMAVSCEPDQTAVNDVEHVYFDEYERKIEDDIITEYYFLENDVIIVNESFGEDSELVPCWTACQAVTDNLGNILAVYDEYNYEVFRAKYDAWGKQTVYLNSIGLTHGYTGHEMLPQYGIINMGGRLYDPDLGRFLSCDNYVQEPNNSQNFNRYSYCLNNPLKYTDPSGEFWHLIIGAAVGGLFNWASHDFQCNAKGLGYFATGALAGAVSAGVGIGANVAYAGGSFWTGAAGVTKGLSATGFFAGFVSGASAGLAGGFITGAGNSWVEGKGFGSGLLDGLNMGLSDAVSAGLIGGTIGGIDALLKHTNFFTGARKFDMNGAFSCVGCNPEDMAIGEGTITGKYVGKFEGQNVFESKKLGSLRIPQKDGLYHYRAVTIPERGIIGADGLLSSGRIHGTAMMQHEFGHILQYRKVGAVPYWNIIAPESFTNAALFPSSHDTFWTETWANYLSKEYFGAGWLGTKYGYPVSNIDVFNSARINAIRNLYILQKLSLPFLH